MKLNHLQELVSFLVKETLSEISTMDSSMMDPSLMMDPNASLQTQADPAKQQKMARDAKKAAIDKVKQTTKDFKMQDKQEKGRAKMWKLKKRSMEKQINTQKISANRL